MSAGSKSPARIPMMAMTTSNSISVKAVSWRGRPEDLVFIFILYIMFWFRESPITGATQAARTPRWLDSTENFPPHIQNILQVPAEAK
jgi:hypothetical protein